MPAGTIALTNNSASVSGTGTSFTTEFKVGDFVGVVVGGAPYTMIVASVASNTQLSLSVPFNGPSASGLAWYAVPASLKIAISQQTLNDIGTNARSMILQMDNWHKIYSDAASVTVTRTDRSTFTGPSWGYMATQFGNKLDKTQNLSDLADKPTARTNLGLGNSATRNVGTDTNSVAAGNDSRITNAVQLGGGTLMTGTLQTSSQGFGLRKTGAGWRTDNSTQLVYADAPSSTSTWTDLILASSYWAYRIVLNVTGSGGVWEFRNDGSFRSSGNVFAGGTQLTSDKRLKSNFASVEYDINDIDRIIPHYYDKSSPDNGAIPQLDLADDDQEPSYNSKDKLDGAESIPAPADTVREMGVVAQELQEVLPELVTESYWNEKYPDLLSVNYSGLTAWLAGYCKILKDRIVQQDAVIAELQKRMKAIDGLDA